jgi:hypothetical protein
MHPCTLDDLVDGVARPVHGHPTRSSWSRETAFTAGRSSRSLSVANRSVVNDRQRDAALDRTPVGSDEVLLGPSKTSTGWRNIGR